MSTPEAKVKARVKQVLKEFKAYWHMPVQNGMGAPSLDFVGCHAGRFFGIETKPGSKPMTDRQRHTASEMQKAGGTVFLVNDVQGLAELKQWLQEVCDGA